MAATKVGRFEIGGVVYFTGYTDVWALYLAKVKADLKTVVQRPRLESRKLKAHAASK